MDCANKILQHDAPAIPLNAAVISVTESPETSYTLHSNPLIPYLLSANDDPPLLPVLLLPLIAAFFRPQPAHLSHNHL